MSNGVICHVLTISEHVGLTAAPWVIIALMGVYAGVYWRLVHVHIMDLMGYRLMFVL
jgi:hypothetical protein